jgi:hypothetical protein
VAQAIEIEKKEERSRVAQAYPNAVIEATDPISGKVVLVRADGYTLLCRSKDQKDLWTASLDARSTLGTFVIRHVSVKDGVVEVVVGKHTH